MPSRCSFSTTTRSFDGGIAQLLETEDDIEVVGEAGTAAQALARIPAVRPDVAILDVRLPDGEGVTVCRDVRSSVSPPPACLMLTSFSDDEALFGAIMAGASGYLLKQVAGTDLIGAVRTIASGGSLLDPKATAVVLQRLRQGEKAEDPPVTQGSHRRSGAFSTSSLTASPTSRSAPRCTWRRRRSRTTCRPSCTNSASPAAPRPLSTPNAAGQLSRTLSSVFDHSTALSFESEGRRHQRDAARTSRAGGRTHVLVAGPSDGAVLLPATARTDMSASRSTHVTMPPPYLRVGAAAPGTSPSAFCCVPPRHGRSGGPGRRRSGYRSTPFPTRLWSAMRAAHHCGGSP